MTRAKGEPIDLYFWPTPNGWKISIMLEECGLPYVVHPVNIAEGEQFRPEFLAISPNNRMPAIVDHDGPGDKPLSVFESGAILQYLGRKTGRFYPKSERARVQVDEWLFWQTAGLGPMAGQAHHFRLYTLAGALRDRPVHQGMQPPLRRHGPTFARARIPGRQVLDRRHSLRRLGKPVEAARAGHRAISASQAMAHDLARAPRGPARPRLARRGGSSRRHPRSKGSRNAVRPDGGNPTSGRRQRAESRRLNHRRRCLHAFGMVNKLLCYWSSLPRAV